MSRLPSVSRLPSYLGRRGQRYHRRYIPQDVPSSERSVTARHQCEPERYFTSRRRVQHITCSNISDGNSSAREHILHVTPRRSSPGKAADKAHIHMQVMPLSERRHCACEHDGVYHNTFFPHRGRSTSPLTDASQIHTYDLLIVTIVVQV